MAGIPIVQLFWGGRAFGRIDSVVDRESGQRTLRTPVRSADICAQLDCATLACASPDASGTVPAEDEGHPVVEDVTILKAMEPALAHVRALQATPLGVVLDWPLARTGNPESPLGNLFADALREEGAADIALNNNSLGGLRADPANGPITFGQLYDTFPFDNRLVRVRVTADVLVRGIANALRRGRPGAFGISGARVSVSCADGGVDVHLFRPNGQPIDATESLVVVGMDSLLGGQMFAPVIPPGTLHVGADSANRAGSGRRLAAWPGRVARRTLSRRTPAQARARFRCPRLPGSLTPAHLSVLVSSLRIFIIRIDCKHRRVRGWRSHGTQIAVAAANRSTGAFNSDSHPVIGACTRACRGRRWRPRTTAGASRDRAALVA
ncbi:MAG: 5'-nucleotidase [Vicinamibacterales bacterium]